jgi:hypothetical protein
VYARQNSLLALEKFGKILDFQIPSRAEHSAIYTSHISSSSPNSFFFGIILSFHSTDLRKIDFHGMLCGTDAFLQGLLIRRNKQEKQICGKIQYQIV